MLTYYKVMVEELLRREANFLVCTAKITPLFMVARDKKIAY